MKVLAWPWLVACVSLCTAAGAQTPGGALATDERRGDQGLRNEGFDPGVPDGLFGTRTGRAIRIWQEARSALPTGYLDGEQAELLRAAGAPRSAGTGERAAVAPQLAESSAAVARATVNCEAWNTQEFFETTTVDVVTACLATAADVEARDDDGITPPAYAVGGRGRP